MLVGAAGVCPTLLVEAFAGTELHLLGQLDGGRHEVREANLVSMGQWGGSGVNRMATAAASRAVQAGGQTGRWVGERRGGGCFYSGFSKGDTAAAASVGGWWWWVCGWLHRVV